MLRGHLQTVAVGLGCGDFTASRWHGGGLEAFVTTQPRMTFLPAPAKAGISLVGRFGGLGVSRARFSLCIITKKHKASHMQTAWNNRSTNHHVWKLLWAGADCVGDCLYRFTFPADGEARESWNSLCAKQ